MGVGDLKLENDIVMSNRYFKKENMVLKKSFDFALKIIQLYKYLLGKREYVISKQILKSGTSVGANIREAQNAESKADFIHKLAISQKEADETSYWLDLLFNSGYISKECYNEYLTESDSLLFILKSILIKSKMRRYHHRQISNI